MKEALTFSFSFARQRNSLENQKILLVRISYHLLSKLGKSFLDMYTALYLIGRPAPAALFLCGFTVSLKRCD
jgi:hypothetical protein